MNNIRVDIYPPSDSSNSNSNSKNQSNSNKNNESHIIELQRINRQKLLNNNPAMLRKLIEYNTIMEEIQLLEFIKLEQEIITDDLVKDKIPALLDANKKIQTTIEQEQSQIRDKKQQIEQLSHNIQQYKTKILKKCMDNTQNKAKNKAKNAQLQDLISKLSSIAHKPDKRAISSLRNDNKQNIRTNNGSSRKLNTIKNQSINFSVGKDKQGYEQGQIQFHRYALVKVRTENKLFEDKINMMKEQIRKKINMLDTIKKQVRDTKQQISMKHNTNSTTHTDRRNNNTYKSECSSIIISNGSTQKKHQRQ